MTQTNSIRPRRLLVPQREVSRNPRSQAGLAENVKEPENEVSLSQNHAVKDLIEQTKSTMTIIGETPDESVTPPSISGLMTKSFDGSFAPDAHRDELVHGAGCQSRNVSSALNAGSQHVDGQKMVRFSVNSNKTSQGKYQCLVFSCYDILSSLQWFSTSTCEIFNSFILGFNIV